MNSEQLFYGGVPVPYAASWEKEETFFLGYCPHSGQMALRQIDCRGQGKPNFGKPHFDRQREVIALELCDICAKPLKNRTKVSLSHARPVLHGANGLAVLQVEPLLHKECAFIAMKHCPSLRRDIRAGTLMVRQVTRHRVQFAVMDEIYTFKITGKYQRSIGHAKVELLAWVDRDKQWLALNLPSSSFAFPVMLIGATLWMVVSYVERRMSLFWLNLVFAAINIIGIWRWWQ